MPFSGDALPSSSRSASSSSAERRGRFDPSAAVVDQRRRRARSISAAVVMTGPGAGGRLREQHGAGHRDVHRLGRVHRDGDELVEREARQSRPARFVAEHDRGRDPRGRSARARARRRRPRRPGARRRRRAPPTPSSRVHPPGSGPRNTLRPRLVRPSDCTRRPIAARGRLSRRPPRPRCGSAFRRCRDR